MPPKRLLIKIYLSIYIFLAVLKPLYMTDFDGNQIKN